MAQIQRRKTYTAVVGGVRVGSDAPIVVQSMTNTDTADIDGTIRQCAALARAGSELVRVTVNNDAAAAAVPYIVDGLDRIGLPVPIIGDFHYNGHILLKKYPECARTLAKYRINPGNVSIGKKDDDNFRTMIDVAIQNNKPVRIGVNWGSLDSALLTRLMDENSKLDEPKDARDVTMEAMVQSALRSADLAVSYGLRKDQIILSAKVSGVQDLIDVYRELARRCEYPLHLGLTEAGMGSKGIVSSAAALGVVMQEGIGDTIRVSLTPAPNGDRTEEVQVAQQILQSMRSSQLYSASHGVPRLRPHHQHLLPGNGGADSGLPARADAAMEDALLRRGRDEGRSDGLRGQRTGRIEALQYRHFTAWHLRGAQGSSVRRWPLDDDTEGRPHRGRVHEDSRRLCRFALCRERAVGHEVGIRHQVSSFSQNN